MRKIAVYQCGTLKDTLYFEHYQVIVVSRPMPKKMQYISPNKTQHTPRTSSVFG